MMIKTEVVNFKKGYSESELPSSLQMLHDFLKLLLQACLLFHIPITSRFNTIFEPYTNVIRACVNSQIW